MNSHTPPPMSARKPAQQPLPPKPKRQWKLPTAIGATALLIGVGIGTSAAGGVPETPEPEVITETETVTEEVEVEVEVERTPQSCLTAIDYAEEAIGYSSDIINTLSVGIEYYLDGDISGIEASTAQVESLTGDVERITPDYQAARDDCRSK